MEVAVMKLVGLRLQQRTVRLSRIDARLTIHQPGFAEKVARIELKVEAHLAQQEIGYGFIQVDGHKYAVALRFYTYLIYYLIVGIDHRVKACEMARGIRITECGDDGIAINLTFQLLRHGLPLTGRRLHTEITVRRHAAISHQHADTTLMTFRIEVTESHHVDTTSGEVSTAIQLEVLC